MNWTKLFDERLEKLLPVKYVMREPGIPVSIGNSFRNWRTDYSFYFSGMPFVVEVKLGALDRPIDGTKVLAYRKIFNAHTAKNYSALIVSRKDSTNAADLLLCGLLHISILTVDFQKIGKNLYKFRAKLDGSKNFEAVCDGLGDETPIESNARGLESHSG